MMIKKIAAGLSAAVLAATMMSVSVSAAKLGDVVHPSEEDTKMNDSYYSIGAMGFYMGQDWNWNQGDWVGIDDSGKISIEYKISAVIADKTMSGKGTLGDMGVMVANLPDGVYPVDVRYLTQSSLPRTAQQQFLIRLILSLHWTRIQRAE